MKLIGLSYSIITCWFIIFCSNTGCTQVYVPIKQQNRQTIENIKLTNIGEFGLVRKSRPQVPSHLHTGIDILRPTKNYKDEPVYSISKGKVISKRDDGPFAQLIIEHQTNGRIYWSLYEHIAGIKVNVGDSVDFDKPIARFMTQKELNQFGWQFDHVHLEILKIKPIRIKPEVGYPQRLFNSYNLVCFTKKELENYYYNPFNFFKMFWNSK